MFYIAFRFHSILGFFPLTGLLWCAGATAACEMAGTAQTAVFSVPARTVTVTENVHYKEAILDVSFTPATGSTVENCTNEEDKRESVKGTYIGLADDGISKIFSTNIPGIGYAITFSENGTDTPWPYSGQINGARDFTGGTFRFRLFVMGKFSPGTLDTGIYGNWILGNVNWAQVALSGPISINSAACIVETPNIQVSLDDIQISELTATGKTLKPESFNVGLNCNPFSVIQIQMRGMPNPDSATEGVLSLTNQGNAGVAEGVGIQILYNDYPVKLDSEFIVKNYEETRLNLPFVAQYYQTRGIVTPGKADATMTLELTYN